MNKNILLFGGELFNKGAQSMTFVTVHEIKKRYPNANVILLSSLDYERDEVEKNQYNFEILPINTELIFQMIGGGFGLISKFKKGKKNKYKSLLPKLNNIIRNTEAIIDISGYALSSQFEKIRTIGYIARIMLAKKYNIKMYLMPQSFGPFEYDGISKEIIKFFLKKYLKYPTVIYARENEGFKYLTNDLKLKNVKKSHDLVLIQKEIDLLNVYKSKPKLKKFTGVNGIAIIPNMKNFLHGNYKEILEIYDVIIKELLIAGKSIYLIRHSHEDIKACEMIKERFQKNNQVQLIKDEMSCLEFDQLVKKFDFIIGSRFHSIVHAYKNSIPCIALGWATKYHELLKTFNQEQYIFDVREILDENDIKESLTKMLKHYNKESITINQTLQKIQENAVFDVLNN